MKAVLSSFAAALLVTACSSAQAPMASDAGAPPMAGAAAAGSPMAASTYVPMAASSDMFEIQSGQMAQQMSQNPAIRSFGQMLVTDHTQTSSQLMAAASSAGLPPPPQQLMPQHQAMLDQLRTAGPNFDAAFRDAQINAHQQALQLHQGYASGGDVAALRTVAGQAVPIVQAHLNQAQSLGMTPAAMPASEPMPAPAPAPTGRRAGERG